MPARNDDARGGAPAAERRILLLAPSGLDAAVMRERLADAGVAVCVCADPAALIAEISAAAGAVVLAEEALDPPQYDRLAAALAAQPAWSDLPIILLAVTGHDAGPLAQYLSRAGQGYVSVLERPIRVSTLLAAVHTALRARQRQYEVRDELARRLAAEASLRQAAARDRFRAALSDSLRPLSDPLDVQREATRLLGEYLGAARVLYAEVTPDVQWCEVTVDYHRDVASAVGRYRFDDYGHAVMGEFRAGRTLAVADVQADARLTAAEKAAAAQLDLGAYLVVPFMRGGRPAALLSVHYAAPHAWTDDEVDLIEETTERTGAMVARARAESALLESEGFYRQTLESIPGMTFTNTPDGACDYVSEQWVEYTGLPAEAQLGDGWLQVLHPEDRARAQASWRAAVDEREQFDLEYRVRRRDGSYGWFKVRGRALRDASGAIARWIGTAVNVDDFKQAEAALRENDRRKDEFLAMLAHELRNPLAPIRNAVQIVAQLGPAETRLARARDIIARQVTHMTRLVDDLLDVSRITRGKIVLHTERVALREIVDAAVEAARPELEQHEQTLAVQVADTLYVEGDRARLVQVLTNLLTNAAKFSPAGGHVTVWAKVEAAGVVLAVRDTGIGIPREAQERIFDLFTQEETAVERARGGLGIGLTLVRRLIELHGGTVQVHSEGPGRGTEFTVTLPLLENTAAPEAEPARAVRPGGQLRILVVEDNADSAESFRMLLELDGHDVQVAGDGRKGLRAIDSGDPDVAFVDLGLPEIDGWTLARRIREQGRERPYLVALSGYGREEDKQRALQSGFDEHLTKPVDCEVVRALLMRVGGTPVVDESSHLLH